MSLMTYYKKLNFGDKTTVAHITALSAVSEDRSNAIISQLKNSKINLINFTVCPVIFP